MAKGMSKQGTAARNSATNSTSGMGARARPKDPVGSHFKQKASKPPLQTAKKAPDWNK